MPKQIDPAIRLAAEEMRREGASLNDISKALGVAKSTASYWVRHIPLTDAQRAVLEANARGVSEKSRLGQLAWSRRCRDARVAAQLSGRELARRKDADFIAGCMLFWAEGSKERNKAELTNSDVAMLQYWTGWVQHWFPIGYENITLRVNCFLGNGLELAEIEDHWLLEVDLPRSCLRRSIVNRASSASKRVRKPLLYGTACVSVHSTAVVQAIYGAIQEFTDVDRPEWLDLRTAVRETPVGA